MKIQIDYHTLKRAEKRGTNIEEIKEVIETGFIPINRDKIWKDWKSKSL